MKRLALILALACCLPMRALTVRTVTIDHTKMGASNQTNFPVLFTGTYSYLATVANGGLVANSSGFDVEFWADAAMTTKLPWETVLWTASNGQVAYWINVPTASHTADTVIYLSYGNAAVTTDQSNKTGTWNSDFIGVYHFQQAAGPYLDSTSNAKNSTGGTHPTAVSSTLIPGINAQSFVTASSQTISFTSFPLSGIVTFTPTWTASGWFKTSTGVTNALFDWRGLTGASSGPVLYLDSSCHLNYFVAGAGGAQFAGSTSYCDGNWHQFVLNGVTSIYIDKTAVYTGAGKNIGGTTGGFIAGSYDPTFPTMVIDEYQFSNTVSWSADYVTANYNNVSSPSTFYTIGAAVTTASGNAFWWVIP